MVKHIGQIIKTIRIDRRMCIQDLATSTKVSRPYISQIESGTKFPSAHVLGEIAKGLKVSKLYLYKEAGYLEETDILELIEENKRLKEEIALLKQKEETK